MAGEDAVTVRIRRPAGWVDACVLGAGVAALYLASQLGGALQSVNLQPAGLLVNIELLQPEASPQS